MSVQLQIIGNCTDRQYVLSSIQLIVLRRWMKLFLLNNYCLTKITSLISPALWAECLKVRAALEHSIGWRDIDKIKDVNKLGGSHSLDLTAAHRSDNSLLKTQNIGLQPIFKWEGGRGKGVINWQQILSDLLCLPELQSEPWLVCLDFYCYIHAAAWFTHVLNI